jgi:hypothetical protein
MVVTWWELFAIVVGGSGGGGGDGELNIGGGGMTPISVTAMVERSGISLRKAPLRASMTSLWLGVTRTSGSKERGSISLVPAKKSRTHLYTWPGMQSSCLWLILKFYLVKQEQNWTWRSYLYQLHINPGVDCLKKRPFLSHHSENFWLENELHSPQISKKHCFALLAELFLQQWVQKVQRMTPCPSEKLTPGVDFSKNLPFHCGLLSHRRFTTIWTRTNPSLRKLYLTPSPNFFHEK